ncbi:TetR/AcrR family transcriptional regulator [Actinoplanes sp. NPDC000266]
MSRIRLTAEERQEQLVAAAVTAFSSGGYAGTTTDQVARLAGVSQPYVIRLFRTKQELFLAAMHHTVDLIDATFRAAADREPTLPSLGHAYFELLGRRELMAMLLHGFAASDDPAIGDPVRAGFGRLYDTIRGLTGCSPEEARAFFGEGMLLTCLASMRVIGPAAVPLQPWSAELAGTYPDEKFD